MSSEPLDLDAKPIYGFVHFCEQCGRYIEYDAVDSVMGHSRSDADSDGDECEVQCGPVKKFIEESALINSSAEVTALRARVAELDGDAEVARVAFSNGAYAIPTVWANILRGWKPETLMAFLESCEIRLRDIRNNSEPESP